MEEAVAHKSETVKTMLTDMQFSDDSEPVPLVNVNGRILAKVVQWATYHKDEPAPPHDEDDDERRSREIPQWDQDFLAKFDQSTLFEIIMAANYLDVKGLMEVSCKTVANMIKGKSVEEIRKHFNIENDFTPEEEEKIRKENEWCEEK